MCLNEYFFMKNRENHRDDNVLTTPWFRYVLFFIGGVLMASLFWFNYGNSQIKAISAQILPVRQKNNPYTFINPLLTYEIPANVKEFKEYKPLEQEIDDVWKSQYGVSVDDLSVYFRDLKQGRWVGVNQDALNPPASMMKVAIMIAYYKEAENNPAVLQQSLNYSQQISAQISEIPFQSPSSLQVGKNYTIDQLIDDMIVHSDNGSKNLLLDNVDQSDLNEIYTDLGLPNPSDNPQNFVISAKQYSLLLRVLYNATYLSRSYSEKALKILSQADFKDGIVAGVPNGTVVAQKFGENVDSSNASALEITLSNCGIVYHSTDPYILCVMTKGKDLSVLEKAIVSVSQTTWNTVNSYAFKAENGSV